VELLIRIVEDRRRRSATDGQLQLQLAFSSAADGLSWANVTDVTTPVRQLQLSWASSSWMTDRRLSTTVRR
jgi:hypothetical protein